MKVTDQFINTVWSAVPLAERRAILAEYITGGTRPTVITVGAEPTPVVIGTRAPKAKRARRVRAKKVASADVQATILAKVKNGTAYTGKEIAALTGIGQPAVDRAIKALRGEKKIHMGGAKRFSFYATDRATAEAAAAKAQGKPVKATKKAPKVNTKRKHANGAAATA